VHLRAPGPLDRASSEQQQIVLCYLLKVFAAGCSVTLVSFLHERK
jgi:hypothetical protein